MAKLWQYFTLASMLLLMGACVQTATHGHLKEDEGIGSIKVGTTTKAQAQSALGSPSSESSFGPLTWYYVSSIRQNRSIFAPELVDQRVLEIGFDQAGVVSSMKQYSLKDSKDIQVASRTTPTEGQQLGFFEQILANLGRFNKGPEDSTSNSHTHGNTNPSGYPGR